jgi:hypothetical protein
MYVMRTEASIPHENATRRHDVNRNILEQHTAAKSVELPCLHSVNDESRGSPRRERIGVS